MELPFGPPLQPMLARLARELPGDGSDGSNRFVYEPKWDGFRAITFRGGDVVDMRSRHQRPLARYFPELVAAVRALPEERFVLDGEVVVLGERGFDFEALMSRLHPAASRVTRLSRETPASLVAFDLLAVGPADLRRKPFAERRAALERLLAGAAPPLFLTPATEDRAVALEWLERFRGSGIDGVLAKPLELPYEPGKRAMTKVKPERTAECVVAGFRVVDDEPLVASLLLGLYEDGGELRHVGVSSSFTEPRRRELFQELRPLVIPLAEHPWREGFLVGGGPLGRLKGAAGRWTPDMEHEWVPVRPERVCEVGYDQVDRGRFRHPARFLRWRPDRDPRSCRFDQLDVSPPVVGDLLRSA